MGIRRVTMPKNYYLALGLQSNATPVEIKDAYRRLAKEFHPDHYGEDDSHFRAVQEAYSVLSDPVRRRNHDRMTQERIPETRKTHPYATNMKAFKGEIEPLIPEQAFRNERMEPMGPGPIRFRYPPNGSGPHIMRISLHDDSIQSLSFTFILR
jgi:curved DNA-binding protein CbpA